MKLRIGKPAIAPQADEPIAPLQKSVGQSPFSKLLRAANDEPRAMVMRAQTSGLPANDPAREVPLLTVAHGPLQPPPNPGRRATDVVKTPSSERGLVERLRVVSEPKAEAVKEPTSDKAPQQIVNDRRASDPSTPAAKSTLAHVDSKPAQEAQPAKAEVVHQHVEPISQKTADVVRPAHPDSTPRADSALPAVQPKLQSVPSTPQEPTRIVLSLPTTQASSTRVEPKFVQPKEPEQTSPTILVPLSPTAQASATKPEATKADTVVPHTPTLTAPAKQQPSVSMGAPTPPAASTIFVPLKSASPAQQAPASAPKDQPTLAQFNFSRTPTTVALPTREQPNSNVVIDRPRPETQPAKTNARLIEPTNVPPKPGPPRTPIALQALAEPSQAAPTAIESPRPDPKPVSTLHRRRVVDSNVQQKPHTEKNAPAQSPTAPLVTTSNTSFVAAPDRRLVARASPDTLAAPLAQDFTHRPSPTVRDEATPTPSHAPALREPPAIAATLFSVSPTVTATAVDTKHFVTASQPLKSHAATTAPMARHAAEQRPNAPPVREQGHVAQVLQFVAQRTTKPTEPDKNASVEAPSQRKPERVVETKKASEPERDDKTVTPLPTQPAPLQPTDLPPPQRTAEASAPQPPNPLPNVAPAYLDDPSLRVVVLPNIARLSVETQDSGTLSLQVKVHDGVTDIRAAGPAASLVEARQGELRLALAHEGLALGHFDLTQSDHQGAPQHHFEPHDERDALPRRTHVRSESSSSTTTRAEGRLSVKA